MNTNISYKKTVMSCYIGNFTQAVVVNLTPIIFIPLREEFGFSYAQFGLLILINFLTQVAVDILFSGAVDRHGFRPFVVSAHIICVTGFLLFVATPFLFKGNEFIGFLISTIIFSSSGGLLEVLLSPIIDAIPTNEKEKAMAMLHSFYAWGQVAVVIITTLMLFLKIHWTIITLFWAIIPFINIFMFLTAPLNKKVMEQKIMKISVLIKNPVFIAAFFTIILGGASEVTMAQWASSFMDRGLNIPKIWGDLLGMCGFAMMLGIGRLIYGIYGNKLNIHKALIYGSAFAFVLYMTAALSPFTWISIIACAVTGICVSLLWPGTLSIASAKLPFAGASMFALLSAGGDIGASIGPMLTGFVTDSVFNKNLVFASLTSEQLSLRIGLLVASLYPLLSCFMQIILKKRKSI